MVPQFPQFIPGSIVENVAFGLPLEDIDLDELDNAYDEDMDKEDSTGNEDGGQSQQQTPDMGGNSEMNAPMPNATI